MRKANRWVLVAALTAFALLFVWTHRGELRPAERLAPIVTVENASLERGGYLINVNTADAETFESLPGIGEVLAERIVAYREENGPFASVDALDEVEGIGEGKLNGIRSFVTAE